MANKFKKGDILKPIKGKRSSNYICLEHIKEVVVISETNTNYVKNMIKVCMRDGIAYDSANYTTYYKNNSFHIYDDAFELLIPEEENYEIY